MATSYPAVQETQLGAPVADYRGSVVRRVMLSVSQVGISNGKEMLPWNEVKSVLFSNDFVFVMKGGKKLRWAAARIAKTPNIYVLSALVIYIKRGGQ